MTAADSPLTAENLRERVSDALEDFLEQRRPLLTGISDDLVVLANALSDSSRSGKRLRPAFCWWGFRGAGGADSAEAITAVTSLELLQACALIHDDVMDESDTRRGLPAAHRRFGAIHKANDWQGDPDQFGEAGAILLGDLCLAWADEMYFNSGLPADDLLRGKPILDIMRTELLAGQYLDLVEQVRASASVERALTVARYKSAKYTVERPLQLGAALAGGSPELLDALSRYGLPLGEAFQLRDDVLGVFGDPDVTGKPAGDDLREGKRNLLIALSFEGASESEQSLLSRSLGKRDLADEDVAVLREIIVNSGALAKTEELIAGRTEEALQALGDAEITETAREVLSDLAFAATRRTG